MTAPQPGLAALYTIKARKEADKDTAVKVYCDWVTHPPHSGTIGREPVSILGRLASEAGRVARAPN